MEYVSGVGSIGAGSDSPPRRLHHVQDVISPIVVLTVEKQFISDISPPKAAKDTTNIVVTRYSDHVVLL